jgi:hypothetical protein
MVNPDEDRSPTYQRGKVEKAHYSWGFGMMDDGIRVYEN